MQGQRGAIGLPETLSFDHGSTSASAVMDQQICWNNMRNPTESQLQDCLLSSSDVNITYVNAINQEQQNLSGWSVGEPSSSSAQNEVNHDERKTEHGWSSSSSTCTGLGPRLEEPQYGPTNFLSLEGVNRNPQLMQSSNTDVMPQNLNLNAGFVGHGGDNGQVMERPDMYKSSVSECDRIPPSNGSDSFLLPSGSGGYFMEENNSRPGSSLEGRRASCKRKALDGNVGQSSVSGSCSYFQCAESSAWPGVPARYGTGSNSSISAPSEPVNPRLGLGVRGISSENIPDSNIPGNVESSQRNLRLRINPSTQQESIPPPLFSTSSVVRNSSVSGAQQLSGFVPVDHSLELRPAPVVDNTSSQNQPVVIPAPVIPRSAQSFRWNESSSGRVGSSSSSFISGDRDVMQREEASSRSMSRNVARNLWEHPMLVPATEFRNLVRNPPNRSLPGGNMSIPASVASSSRAGPSSGVHPSSAPPWAPHPSPPSRSLRRLSEYARRSLFSAIGAESGGQSSSHPPLHSGPPVPSEETMLSSGSGSLGHNRSYTRSLWLERQGDGVVGIPYPLRTLVSASEGRNRLVVSEIRNVLDLMRRNDSLRFEDVMILDQSVLFGVADIHDRHRDMRLDVDNMSYEELLALEERIGNVSTGLSEETILNRLKQRQFSTIAIGTQVEAEPCCICQEDYNDGEDLGMLDCGHNFHTDCVKQWLMHKNLCPICKTTALAT